MVQLPIFPLHAVVFPGQSLRLHIFEPRYRRLIQDCITQDSPFGIALIRSGLEAGGPLPEAYRIGCIVEFVRAEPLPYGRYQVYCRGRERYQMLDWLDIKRPYLVADVLPWPVEGEPDDGQEHTLRELLATYLQLLPLGYEPPIQAHTTPLRDLAFQAAANLSIPLFQKQQLLEAPDLSTLIEMLLMHYRKEISLLNLMQVAEKNLPPSEEDHPLRFSQN
ncbi:MAG: hypothetical protein D6755_10910 [Anaerolineae bacterium]|nr:MAG: hypothetical protein D6755_10910 [Anaerolineae bacterium]